MSQTDEFVAFVKSGNENGHGWQHVGGTDGYYRLMHPGCADCARVLTEFGERHNLIREDEP